MLNAPRLARLSPTIAQPIILTGGLNEQLTNFELRGGELTDVQNYVEKDGSANGYTSFQGYERFDGQPSPSDVSLVIDPVTGEVTDDTAREAARALIAAIPGGGNTLGVNIYDDDVYGWRDNVGFTANEMWKATGAGWVQITSATQNPSGTISMEQIVNSRFALYKSNAPVTIWVDGVSPVHTYDGTTVATITSGDLPAITIFATHAGVWNNRLFLAYPGGNVFFSVVGDPTDFSAVNGAGTFQVGDDITGFTVTPGGDLLLLMKDRIEFITDDTSTVAGSTFSFSKQTFSDVSGAIGGTSKRMLGTIYFADDRGVTTLQAAQEYGDFVANSLAKKVEQTYQDNKGSIVLSTINRQDNQYILFFNGANNAEGLVFSFKGKRLKGATKIKLDHLVYNIAEGKSGSREDEVYFGSTAGFVYKLYTGTSFDGEDIETRMATSFYHYNSPTRWKHFKEVMFEVSGDAYTELTHREEYDYNELYFPTPQAEVSETETTGGVWGVGVWGVFTWGGSSLTRLKDKILGYGTNMRLLLVTSDKYKAPHSLHNMTVQYVNGAIKT